MIDPELDINGQWPKLDGAQLQELLCEEFWYDEKLEEPANIVHIKTNGKWIRLYFDHAIIFWRDKSKRPESSSIVENSVKTEYRVVDLAEINNLKGEVIESVVPTNIEGGSQVEFSFGNGTTVKFKCINDVTTYET